MRAYNKRFPVPIAIALLAIIVFVVYVVVSTAGAERPREDFQVTYPEEGKQYFEDELTIVWKGLPSNHDAQIVIFRKNEGRWNIVRKIKPAWQSKRLDKASPFRHFCRDVYAIRVMSGTRTLPSGGPIHFTIGTGACSGPPDKFINLEDYQVDLDHAPYQGRRDTCGAFAAAAALEAAYVRRYESRHNTKPGLLQAPHISTQYIHHIVKSSWYEPERFLYENQSSFWGGNDPVTIVKFLSEYPIPSPALAKYKTQNELDDLVVALGIAPMTWDKNPKNNIVRQWQIDTFEYDPRNIPHLAYYAAQYGVKEWEKVSVKDTDKLEDVLRSQKEIIFALDTNCWEKSDTQAKTYNYKQPPANGEDPLAHLMTIVGFDKTVAGSPYFLLKNSWGDGIIRVSYEAVKKADTGGVYIKSLRPKGVCKKSKWLGKWHMIHDNRWKGELYIRRYAEVNDFVPKSKEWVRMGEYRSTMAENRGNYDVVGKLSDSGGKLTFYIDFSKSISFVEKLIEYDDKKPPVWAMVRKAGSLVPNGKVPPGQTFEFTLPESKNVDYQPVITGRTKWRNRWFEAKITRP